MAPRVLAALPLAGHVVTGDALLCQRALCRQIQEQGGDYFFVVKANQPRLLEDLTVLFEWPAPGEAFATVERRDRHGDRVEHRRLWASTALNDYLDWPGVGQVCKVERTVDRGGRTTREVAYAITSLGPHVGPGRLLGHWRGHWGIENRLHYVRDVTFGEDASTVRTAAAPEVLAAIRNALLTLLRQAGCANIAAALRSFAWRPGSSLRLLGISLP